MDFTHLICQFHQPYSINVSVLILLYFKSCNGCWEIWLSNEQPHFDHDGQWWKTMAVFKFRASTPPAEALIGKMYKRNYDPYRIPGHGTKTSAVVFFRVHLAWVSTTVHDKPRPRPCYHVPVFCTDLKLHNKSKNEIKHCIYDSEILYRYDFPHVHKPSLMSILWLGYL